MPPSIYRIEDLKWTAHPREEGRLGNIECEMLLLKRGKLAESERETGRKMEIRRSQLPDALSEGGSDHRQRGNEKRTHVVGRDGADLGPALDIEHLTAVDPARGVSEAVDAGLAV